MEFLENFRAFVWKIPDKILDDFSGIMELSLIADQILQLLCSV